MSNHFTRLFSKNLMLLAVIVTGTFVKVQAQGPVISYSPATTTYVEGTAITPATPNNTGTAVTKTATVSTLYQFANNVYVSDVLFDSQGNLFYFDAVSGQINKVTPGGVSTVFASFSNGDSREGMAIDSHDNIYVAGRNVRTIDKITPAGVKSVFAGSLNNLGYADGTGTAATFQSPGYLTVDAQDNIYVSDGGNAIRKITPAAVVTTIVSNINNNNGDGVLTTDSHGNIYYDSFDNNIGIHNLVKISPAGVQLASYNVAASAGGFYDISGLGHDKYDNIYVYDHSTSTISKISASGTISTLAGVRFNNGNADGDGSVATFYYSKNMAFDAAGNLFLADYGNSSIRKITLTGYNISPALPAGLAFDENTGTISGTPAVFAASTVYNITASDGVNHNTTTFTFDVTQSPPVITTITPASVVAINPGQITVTGSNFGSSLADVTSITYGANGTENTATGVIWDSPTQLRFTAAALTPGSVNKITITILTSAVTSTVTFRAAIPPNITYTPNIFTYTQGTAITAVTPSNTGDALTASATVSTIAGIGHGANGYIDGIGANAQFGYQYGMASDSHGNIYSADGSNNVIHMTTSAGVLTTIATGFSNPFGVAVDAQDNIYVADNGTVQKITKSGNTYNNSTFASGFGDARWVAADQQGNVYVSDIANNAITKLTVSGGVVTNTTTFATVNQPGSLYFDSHGNLFVVAANVNNANNADIVKIAPDGTSTIFLSTTNNPGSSIVLDKADNIYLADNGQSALFEITPKGAESKISGGYGYQDGDLSSANFTNLYGIAIDPIGNIYLDDATNYYIRKVTFVGYRIAPNLVDGLTIDPSTGTISGTPALSLAQTTYQVTASDGQSLSTVPLTITVNQVPPIISGIAPASVVAATPGQITLTGSFFGSSAADVASITYGPDGTGTNATDIIWDSSTQLRFTAGALTQGTSYKVIVTVINTPSAASVATFRAIIPPNVTYSPNPATFAQGVAITPAIPANSGDPITTSATVSTIAGTPGTNSFANGTGSAASFFTARGIVSDSHGNIFVADQQNNQIRKVTPAGVVTTFAGSTISGFADGTGVAAQFNQPNGITIDAQDNLYVADQGNNEIRKITPAGVVTTFAGSNNGGSADGTGTAAQFNQPTDITSDSQGNLYVFDGYNYTVRKITPAGVVSTLAGTPGVSGNSNGTGASAQFNGNVSYTGITADAQGNVYLGDSFNQQIRKITPAGVVTTFVSGVFYIPSHMVFDKFGNLYVGDAGYGMIDKIAQDGTVTAPFAGSYFQNSLVDGPVSSAQFGQPVGLTIDPSGNLFVYDSGNAVIRKITLTGYNITPKLPQGLAFDNNTGTISGTPVQFAPQATYTVVVSDGHTVQNVPYVFTITQTPPAITNIFPALVSANTPGEILVTGSNFGRNLSDIASVTYGPNGTETTATNIVWDNSGQLRFTPGALTPGTTYKVIVTVISSASAASAATFRAAVAPTVSYTGSPFVYTEGTAIAPLAAVANTGDAITAAYTVSTLAGNANNGNDVDSTGVNAGFNFPVGITTDAQGNILVIDHNPATIRKVTPTGVVKTFAGSGNQGYADGQGTAASFNHPIAVVADASGNLYVTDRDNSIIRKITPGGLVSTFAGTPGVGGEVDGTGTAAQFNQPWGIAIDASNNLYVSDKSGNTIRKITSTGVVTTLAGSSTTAGSTNGTGAAALFNNPAGLVTDAQGNVYVADNANLLIRKITPSGVVTTYAGSGQSGSTDGAATTAAFGNPIALTIDGNGNLYVEDKNATIRKITGNGTVSTVAGVANNGGDQDGVGTSATFGDFYGITIDKQGNLLLGDNNSVRKITITGYDITPTLPAGLAINQSTGAITGTPIVASAATNYHISLSNGVNAASTTINLAVTPVPPVVTAFVPSLLNGPAPGEVTMTGNFLGASLADITSLTYGPTGTEFTPSDIKYDSPTQVRFRPSALTPGVDYKVVITVTGMASAASTTTFRAIVPPAISYTTATLAVPQGTAITPLPITNTGDAVTRSYTVSTFAGNANTGGNADGTGINALFSHPTALVKGANNNFYVGDYDNGAIRRITPQGVVTTLDAAVNGLNPIAITFDQQGSLYILDAGSNSIIKEDTTAHTRSTLASGFNQPWAMDIDASGNIYVADLQNNQIKKVTPAGVVTVLAGNGGYGHQDGTGTNAIFAHPSGIAVDTQGNVFVSEDGANDIRKITSAGVVTTFAGNPNNGSDNDGTGTAAGFSSPGKLTFDAYGNLYVLDKRSEAIRKITLAGVVTTIAGRTVPTYQGGQSGSTDGAGAGATFGDFYGIAMGSRGNLFIGDTHTIRKITITGYEVSPLLPAGLTLDGNTGTISGTPTAVTAAANYTVSASNGFTTGTTIENIAVTQAAPVITAISPASVSATGSSQIIINGAFLGTALGDINSITYGPNGTGATATNIVYISSTQLAFTASNLTAGTAYKVIVTVTTAPSVIPASSAVSTVSFRAAIPPTVSYAGSPYVYTEGMPIPALNAAANTGDAITGAYTVSTLAGSGGGGNDVNGTGTSASFNYPAGVSTDAQGNIYVVDRNAATIRKVSSTGITTTIAGSGFQGFNNGQGRAASFNHPMAAVADAAGNLYVTDRDNQVIRKITPGGLVSTFAGTQGAAGEADGTGTAAKFSSPWGLAIDASNNLYVSDQSGNTIRKINPAGVVTTLAGNGASGYLDGTGTTAIFNAPSGITLDAAGNIYVAEQNNQTVRKITAAGVVITLAGSAGNNGSDDGTGTAALFYDPTSVAADKYNNIYVTDNNNVTIRKITSAGVVTTVAGGNYGYQDGVGTNARFTSDMFGIAVDAQGNLLVGDNNSLRKITVTGYNLSPALPAGLVLNQTTGTITGTPLVASPATNYSVIASNGVNTSAAATINIAVNQVAPTIAAFTPNLLDGPAPGEITMTGQFFGASLADITSITYGAAGTGASATNIKFDSPTQVRFTPGVLTPGINYKAIINVTGMGSAPSTATFRALNAPAITYNPNAVVLTQGVTVNPITLTNTGDPVTQNSITTTFAGTPGASGYNNGAAGALFYTPTASVFDTQGNLLVADFDNNVIRKITPAGVVSTLAGTQGVRATTDGTATTAAFNGPHGLTVDAQGNIYVVEAVGNTLRKIDAVTGAVTTLAGQANVAGYADGTTTAAAFNNPLDVYYSASDGNLYVADQGNSIIRKVTLAGVVTTFAGTQGNNQGNADGALGTATFNYPDGLTMDSHGNLIVADANNYELRKVSPAGVVSTLATNVIHPVKITIDARDNVYTSSFDNNTIQKVTPSGTVSTVAGGSGNGYADGNANTSQFSGPFGIAMSTSGALYVSEIYNNDIRKIIVSGFDVNPALPAGLTLDPNSGSIIGTPARVSSAATFNVTASNGYSASTTPITITVNAPAAPAIAFTNGVYSYLIGEAIDPLSPTSTGGLMTGFNSVSTLATGRLSQPYGIVADASGNSYVVDVNNNQVFMVAPSGQTSVFAGSGSYNSQDGTGINASFAGVQGIATDAAGNLFVSESGGNIRKITPAGVVTTIAGDGNNGYRDGVGTSAEFNNPIGLAVDASNNIYVTDNTMIRKLTNNGGVYTVSTLAGQNNVSGNADGTGTAATFGELFGLTIDSQGNLFASDDDYNNIRKITPAGVVTTFSTSNLLSGPEGIAIDNNNNIYVANSSNSSIISISPAGNATAIAGGVNSGLNDGTNTDAQFNNPYAVTVARTGTLYVADYNNSAIRQVGLNYYTISPALPTGLNFTTNGSASGATAVISGSPAALSPSTNYTVTAISQGGVSTATVNITVTAPPVAAISYTPNSQVYPAGAAIANYAPVNTGGAAATGSAMVSTFAGSGTRGSANGTGIAAQFNRPTSTVVDAQGNVYVADSRNSAIRKITPAGVVTTFAGTVGSAGNVNGTGTAAKFNSPNGLAIDAQGNIYVADLSNQLIRKITPAGVVTTLAGTAGLSGSANGTGTAATFNAPTAVAVDLLGNVYVTESNNSDVRMITPLGVVTTIAGNVGTQGNTNGTGTAATFSSPNGITVDNKGNIYVADANNSLIRKITPDAVVTTFAGSGSYGHDDGTGTAASFGSPYGMATDSLGNVYVSDNGGSNYTIRKITPAGVVTTIAGNGSSGIVNGIGYVATFNAPRGLSIDKTGNLYVADYNNSVIRKIAVFGFITDKILPAGLMFDQNTGTFAGTPTTVAAAKTYTVTAINYSGTTSTTATIAVNPPAPAQASSVVFTNITTTGSTITWTNGGGTARAVFIAAATTGSPAPVLNTAFTANITFGLGTQIGTTGWYNVYNGSGSTVTVTGLTIGTNYRVMVVEYNTPPGFITYQTAAATGNPANFATLSDNANLSALALSTSTLSPAFASGTFAYATTVSGSVTGITVTPTTGVGTSTVTVNGVALISGSASANIPLVVGANTITIIVTAEDGVTQKTYTVVITRANPVANVSNIATLSNITLSSGTLSPAFNGGTPSYTASVANTTNSIQLTPTVTDANATITVNGVTVTNGSASAPINLAFGNNTIKTIVTAQDGSTTRTYTVVVTRPALTVATLSGLSISTGTLSPSFASGTTNYTVSVPVNTNYVTVTATFDVSASATIFGTPIPNGSPSFGLAIVQGTTTIPVVVTAQDGVTKITYTITVTENAPTIPVEASNILSPNGDGKNDAWVIKDINLYPNNSVTIYDRAGRTIYTKKGYSNDWKGTVNSAPLAAGTYYYVIDLGNELPVIRGFITILRSR